MRESLSRGVDVYVDPMVVRTVGIPEVDEAAAILVHELVLEPCFDGRLLCPTPSPEQGTAAARGATGATELGADG